MLKIIQEEELDAEELRRALIKLVQARLTRKQKELLVFLGQNTARVNVTRLVPILGAHLQCAPSTVWANLNVLKEIGLVEFGDIETKGKPIRLTKLGELVTGHAR